MVAWSLRIEKTWIYGVRFSGDDADGGIGTVRFLMTDDDMLVNWRVAIFKMLFDAVVQESYGATDVKLIAFGA